MAAAISSGLMVKPNLFDYIFFSFNMKRYLVLRVVLILLGSKRSAHGEYWLKHWPHSPEKVVHKDSSPVV